MFSNRFIEYGLSSRTTNINMSMRALIHIWIYHLLLKWNKEIINFVYLSCFRWSQFITCYNFYSKKYCLSIVKLKNNNLWNIDSALLFRWSEIFTSKWLTYTTWLNNFHCFNILVFLFIYIQHCLFTTVALIGELSIPASLLDPQHPLITTSFNNRIINVIR